MLFLPLALQGQAPAIPNSMTVYGFFGYVRNVSSFPNPVPGLNQNGVAGAIRVMWHPEHLLSFGLDVGLTRVYSVDQTLEDGSPLHATLDALPVHFVFSMSPWRRVGVFVGTGPTFSRSHVESLGNTTSSSAFGASFMASVMYVVPVSQKLGIGGEFKFLRTTTYDDNNISFSLTIAYRFADW